MRSQVIYYNCCLLAVVFSLGATNVSAAASFEELTTIGSPANRAAKLQSNSKNNEIIISNW